MSVLIRWAHSRTVIFIGISILSAISALAVCLFIGTVCFERHRPSRPVYFRVACFLFPILIIQFGKNCLPKRYHATLHFNPFILRSWDVYLNHTPPM
ncbi:uncharacterized protein EI90DRAFT_3048516 [Cantharellus anzutake]|uniref:uncharacterized protein n=1 Tax=Cantharellus anzutake TaxID=1750568 RepID=UPI001905729D|nr:uncharacterized protein EI90DRAFT_3048516 [Cantharellus anzutake]KAF8335478.1 hypothetical protein EI90DRAFT_3048516 [Cantharellus anzutake]